MSASAPADSLTIKAEFPEVLLPLLQPRRYKIVYGGRGGAKSWAFARALLLQCMEEPLRVLCAREIMKTIADSVHRLLSDQIKAMGLEAFFVITETSIIGVSGAEFLFAGLRQQDANKIKSYEGIDVVWVEEAHTVSKRSWDILIPTIRVDGSEIWVSFNPELDTDDTYTRFVKSPPPDAWVQKVTYKDNPWFPEVLEKERLHLLKKDPEEHGYVWDGNPRTTVIGAIYSKEVTKMIEERRIRPIPHDPSIPVHTIWDLGWNDQMSIIMVQKRVSEVAVIDYIEDHFRTLADYVADLRRMPYVWGTDWLPHDGAHKDHKTGKSSEEILKALGRRVKIIPQLTVEAGIKATRMLFPRLFVDEGKCERLVTCWRRYRRGIPESTGEPGHPVHDEYSHGADATRGLAVIVEKIRNDDRAPPPTVLPHEPLDKGMGM